LSPAALTSPDTIFDTLGSTSKDGAIGEMVEGLVAAGRLAREASGPVVEALLEREALGSTGIGRGVAVPHAKDRNVRGVMVALGRSHGGIEFAALDGQPVHLVFLLLSSEDSAAAHLEALAGIAKLARDEHFRRLLRNAEGPGELLAVLREAGAEIDTQARGAADPGRGNG